MTFDEMKERTAADLRQVAAALEVRAKAVEAGDLAQFEDIIDDKWSLWGQMLVLRYAHCQEQRELIADEPLSETVGERQK